MEGILNSPFFKDTVVSEEVSPCLFLIIMWHLNISIKKSLYLLTGYYCYQYEYTYHLINVNSSKNARLYFQLSIFAFNLKFFKKTSQKFGSFAIPTVVVVKGEQRSHHPKGGENVKPNSHEQSKRHVFDSF